MANLTKDKMAPEREGLDFEDPVAATTVIHRGAMVGLDAVGNAVPAAPTTPTMRGVAMAAADNGAGVAGAVRVRVRKGTFRFANSDLDRTDIGADVYVADDNTVASAGTLVAGKLVDVEAGGAWVKID